MREREKEMQLEAKRAAREAENIDTVIRGNLARLEIKNFTTVSTAHISSSLNAV